jgi:L-alanine-DL-glutamate epimerase-like enolase superfamily enzyme
MKIDFRSLMSDPVIITSVEAWRFDGHYLVRVRCKDGDTGVVVVNNRLDYLWPIMKRFVVPYVLGKDARDLPALVDGVYVWRSAYKLAGIAFWNPVAYVELGLLDLMGKRVGKPVGALFGPVIRERIPVYLSSLRRDTTAEEEVAWLGQRLEETGADAVKLKIGGRMSHNADAFPGRTERLIPLARRTFGDNVSIYVDANGSYDAEGATEVGALLADHGVAFLEEPCPWQAYEETLQVAETLDLPVAGGEQDSSLSRFRWMIENGAVDIVQPDMMYNGGMIRALRVAEMAEAAGVPVMPHSPKVGAESAAVLHFASMAPNLGPHQEYRGEYIPPASWYAPSFALEDGAVAVPDGPGLGVTYDPAIWEQGERIF